VSLWQKLTRRWSKSPEMTILENEPPCPGCGSTRFVLRSSALASCLDGHTRVRTNATCVACGALLWRYNDDGWHDEPECPPAGAFVEALYTHRWPSGRRPLATTAAVRLDVLAVKFDAELQSWDEPGLGTARGFCLRISGGGGESDGIGRGGGTGGVVVMLEQTRCPGLPPSDVALYVDATDLARRPVAELLRAVLGVLGLARSELTWVVATNRRR
jgi:hypothetical protein